MHTQHGIRWLSIILSALALGGALAFSFAPVLASEGTPFATVTAGQLNVPPAPA